jgi:NAD(P) transhydrogenase subunit alpha
MKLAKFTIAVFFLASVLYAMACSSGFNFPGKEGFSFHTKTEKNILIRNSDKAGDIALEIKNPGEGKPLNSDLDAQKEPATEYWSMLFVLVLATFIGLGVILRVSRLLHTPLMSLTNAISAIAVVGSIMVTGEDYPLGIRILGAIALFASMTNIVSGFLITDRMLKMFKQKRGEGKQ